MSKWVGKGVYNAIFDNFEDSLSLSRVQCFDFAGVNNEQYADLIEPLMVWLLRRNNDVLYDPVNLGVPKHILIGWRSAPAFVPKRFWRSNGRTSTSRPSA